MKNSCASIRIACGLFALVIATCIDASAIAQVQPNATLQVIVVQGAGTGVIPDGPTGCGVAGLARFVTFDVPSSVPGASIEDVDVSLTFGRHTLCRR